MTSAPLLVSEPIQETAAHTLMRLEKVTKTYFMRGYVVKALEKVSMEILPEDFITISGPSGSGKSTLLNIMGLLTDPNAGIFEFKGQQPVTLSDNERTDLRRNNIGFVFQMHRLFPNLTAVENLAIPLIPYMKGLEFDLVDKARELLNKVGLDPNKDRRAFEMSGGEQQRVAIARALINDPCIILADEPTGNLDEVTSDGIIEIFKSINESMHTSIVLVTHNSKFFPIGNKTYHMENGVISQLR